MKKNVRLSWHHPTTCKMFWNMEILECSRDIKMLHEWNFIIDWHNHRMLQTNYMQKLDNSRLDMVIDCYRLLHCLACSAKFVITFYEWCCCIKVGRHNFNNTKYHGIINDNIWPQSTLPDGVTTVCWQCANTYFAKPCMTSTWVIVSTMMVKTTPTHSPAAVLRSALLHIVS